MLGVRDADRPDARLVRRIALVSKWAGVLARGNAPCVRLDVMTNVVEVPALRGARGSAVLDLTLAAWAENVTFSDFEAYIRRVFPVLECLWAAGSGRMVFTDREDRSNGFCMVCGTLLKQASAFASDPTLSTAASDAHVQAMHVVVMLEARLPRAPLFVLPQPTKASCLQFMVALNMEAGARFTHFFQVGWRRYSGFQQTLAAYGCSDGDALTYIVRWMSAFDSSAGLAEIPVAGLNDAVAKALAGIGALSAPTVEQAVSEVARLLAHSRDKDGDKKVDADVLHASAAYLSLAKEMRFYDVQPIDGLAACTALISTTLCNFGRALLLDASGTKFGSHDDMWRRLHGAKPWAVQALANLMCKLPNGSANSRVAQHFPAELAVKLLSGQWGHGAVAGRVDLYNDFVLVIAKVRYPQGHDLPACAAGSVFTELRSFDETADVYFTLGKALGENIEVAGGNRAFFALVRELLARTCKFARVSIERNALAFRVQRLVEAATEDRANRRRSALSGALQAAADSDVWVEAGSGVEGMINELKILLDKYEDEALNAANAVTHVQLLGGTTRVTPSVVTLDTMIDTARSAASGGGSESVASFDEPYSWARRQRFQWSASPTQL